MKKINIDISKYQKPVTKATSERGELLEKFLKRLNPGRIESGIEPYTPAQLGFKLSHVKTEDLYPFYKDCERANHFSKYFHWRLK